MNRAERRRSLRQAADLATGTTIGVTGPSRAALRQQTAYVFIATPMYGGMCHGDFATSLFRVATVLGNAQIQVILSTRANAPMVTQVRDDLAYDFLDHPECTHLMFIDSDVGFQAEDIVSMIAADKDVIMGLYPRKMIDWGQVAEAVKRGVPPQELHRHTGIFMSNTPDGTDITKATKPGQKPIEITGGGMGFTLIKREVMEGLASKVLDYDAAHVMIGRVPTKPRMKQFFASPVHNGYLLSEDGYFCAVARENGYRIWAAPWVELTHTGTYQFTGRLPG